MPASTTSVLAHDRAGPTGRSPLVLVHAGVADRRMWEPQWASLTGERDVIRVDLRGFGESDERPVGAWSAYGDLLTTLDQLRVERAHLVGCSLGSGVAVEATLARPGLAESLTLVSPGGALFGERTPELAAFAAAEGTALRSGDLTAAVRASVETWVLSPRRTSSEVDAGVQALVADMQRRAFEITADWDDVEEAEEELDPPAIERYGEIEVPMLVLVGELDLDVVHQAADRLLERVPAARRVDWPGVAHLPGLERPAELGRLVLEHVRAAEMTRGLSVGPVRLDG